MSVTWKMRLARQVQRVALPLCAACLVLLFFVTLLGRRLNFDESLALRAGYLALAGEQVRPAFWMPWTAGLGALAHLIKSPEACWLVARTLSVGVPLGAVLVAMHDKRASTAALVLLFILSNQDYVSHGGEFRYDTSLSIALLFVLALCRARGAAAELLLGAVLGALASHHLKGVYYAAACFTLLLVPLWLSKMPDQRTVLRLLAGFCGFWIVWIALSLALAQADELVSTYGLFYEVGQVELPPPRRHPLGASLKNNSIWWLFVCCGGLFHFFRLRSLSSAKARLEASFPWLLAGASLFFLVVHPRPWPYLMAAPALLLALAAGEAWSAAQTPLSTRVLLCGLLLTLLMAQSVWGDARVDAAYRRAAGARWSDEARALRLLRAVSREEDRVLDPSGLAYFRKPCRKDWYTDTLFRSYAQHRPWMVEPLHLPDDCRFLVSTYRLRMMPKISLLATQRHFATGTIMGPFLQSGESISKETKKDAEGLPRTLQNYW